MTFAKNLFGKYALILVLLCTMMVFEFLLPSGVSLFSPHNLNNLIVQNSYVVILAIGMLLCIISGGNIDLAVGSIVILVGAIVGIFIVEWGWNPYLSILLCMGVGALLGSWQAFWIAVVGIPPFIVTLAGMLTFRGIALMLMKGRNIGPFPIEYRNLFNRFLPASFLDQPTSEIVFASTLTVGIIVSIFVVATKLISYFQRKKKGYDVGNIAQEMSYPVVISGGIIFLFHQLGKHNGMPAVLLLIGIIFLLYSYFTQNTIWGRHLYAMGGNAKAARLSGINTRRMLFFAYANNGFLASIAALVVVARFNQASTQAGTNFELDAIAACFIGGASAYGGTGKVGGVVIGAIFMGVLNMGMSLLGADINLQRVINGLVLLVAVTFDVISKKRRAN
ncbi:MAG: sugar ABC transporter permease [Clostridiales bacterium]|jgi:putative multiple sugar transport system permease protein|nr:sugar ABC transporter permease [Clostridiales bacterium]